MLHYLSTRAEQEHSNALDQFDPEVYHALDQQATRIAPSSDVTQVLTFVQGIKDG